MKLIKNFFTKNGDEEEIKTYLFKYKRLGSWFWRNARVVGHRFFEDQNKMVLYKKGGALMEVPIWDECSCCLGRDWAENAVELKKENESV